MLLALSPDLGLLGLGHRLGALPHIAYAPGGPLGASFEMPCWGEKLPTMQSPVLTASWGLQSGKWAVGFAVLFQCPRIASSRSACFPHLP